MTQKIVTLKVNGHTLKAPEGAMLIEVTDAAGIYVPRFCYHKKLSIAANCRMCLVEVARSSKTLPACATPVTEGMEVWTHSQEALKSQRIVMQFLLINHPLDCPICDQGGECELQDLAMGFGSDVSDYTEGKRVVLDKNLGPLISTDLTRCIHCTRCIRFGQEIAGVQELGMIGRGENSQIASYIGQLVSSELSGNVIDVCPVGALTSKPYRFKGRSWELRQNPGISVHDCVGSSIDAHTTHLSDSTTSQVVRVVPRENEAINDMWISDRDRFSYEGLFRDRVTQPMVRDQGVWKQVDWEYALACAADRLSAVIGRHGSSSIAGLISPSATLEEMYLFQALLRGIGTPHIDHRCRQRDFRVQEYAPLSPTLGGSIQALTHLDAILVVGADTCQEQPILAYRWRQAVRRGGKLLLINPVRFDFHMPVTVEHLVALAMMPRALAGVVSAVLEEKLAHDEQSVAPELLQRLRIFLDGVQPMDHERSIAQALLKAQQPGVFLGAIALHHPQAAELRVLLAVLEELLSANVGLLTQGANSAGAWIAGAVPHRGPAGQFLPPESSGDHAYAMLEHQRAAYCCFGLEPLWDCADPTLAKTALKKADCVIMFSSFSNPLMLEYADIILPITPHIEMSGTVVNVEGTWQSFAAATPPLGEARPGWKVLRVLANFMEIPGFDEQTAGDVLSALNRLLHQTAPDQSLCSDPKAQPIFDTLKALDNLKTLSAPQTGLMRCAPLLACSIDSLVRRSLPLQHEENHLAWIRINTRLAKKMGVSHNDEIFLSQGHDSVKVRVMIDERVSDATIYMPSGTTWAAALSGAFDQIEFSRGES